ncbi:hypothetical protein ABEB36_000779 [Hypothenemus hampei]|uniref:peptidyl-tRNA hydrolase n=1 Tax=Hypothenemus hampei TaxID=57062 RepID=A0ABD1FCH4_HYPHA
MGLNMAKLLFNMLNNVFEKVKSIKFVKTKMVFLVRTDLQMGKGKVASQVAHASILLYKDSVKNKNSYLNVWLQWGQPKVVLKIDKNCESAMNNIYKTALNSGLIACKVFDSGKTQIDCGTLTVIGIGPSKAEDIDKITGQFKLL